VPGSFGGFYFGPNPALAGLWQTIGLNSAGKQRSRRWRRQRSAANLVIVTHAASRLQG
jgi:hypothetical protein